MRVAMDQTVTIRASVHDVEITLLISVLLVILVVFVFLREPRSTFHPQRGRADLAGGDVRGDVPADYSIDNLFADGVNHLHRLRGGRTPSW